MARRLSVSLRSCAGITTQGLVGGGVGDTRTAVDVGRVFGCVCTSCSQARGGAVAVFGRAACQDFCVCGRAGGGP